MRYRKYLILWLFVVGCASQQDRLTQEYQRISRQIDALLEEAKAIVTLEMAAKEYWQIRQRYLDKQRALLDIRDENRSQNLVIGPEIESELNTPREIIALQQNHSVIMDYIHKLRQKRTQIVNEQVRLDQ